ncbi:MAG: glycine cleavage system protein GcvH [Candidatus Nezhaarchaeota archaeon]|nr:glycine cleavage system protein GcvH [Candidatus Nezhaarchaeota archaeon]MCX8141744.1 glycine cleavage system protein GcvH [Candidatus Nezhaarchaeota archaeon]MDW8050478.1 glycine cleavage system protein GcvH [Nitrososphaerota archaeon]
MRVNDFEVPAELLYSENHVWVKMEGDLMRLGITDYAQKQLEEILYIELPNKGELIEKGDTIALIESVKTVIGVLSPLDCEVIEVNESLREEPELMNLSPYGEGWIVVVRALKYDQAEELMDAESYAILIKQELKPALFQY